VARGSVAAKPRSLVLVVPTGSIPELDLRLMVMLLQVNLVLYMRAIFIPSSPRRTFAVSAATALPLAIYSLAAETARLSVWKVMWLLAAITIATAGSAVIYGLRHEVRHARQLGQYTLEEKLGEGGMGVVYRARHAMLRRPTAVKLLKPERMGEAGLRRFEREVQLTAGLVHRDIKPGNIMLCERGGLSDVAKVVDFGLVKDLEAEGGTSHDATLVGTPLYLAPEAIRSPPPTRAPISTRSGPWPASS